MLSKLEIEKAHNLLVCILRPLTSSSTTYSAIMQKRYNSTNPFSKIVGTATDFKRTRFSDVSNKKSLILKCNSQICREVCPLLSFIRLFNILSQVCLIFCPSNCRLIRKKWCFASVYCKQKRNAINKYFRNEFFYLLEQAVICWIVFISAIFYATISLWFHGVLLKCSKRYKNVICIRCVSQCCAMFMSVFFVHCKRSNLAISYCFGAIYSDHL